MKEYAQDQQDLQEPDEPAAEVMDQLIELDRFGFAVRAAAWSVEQTELMRAKQ